MPSFRYEAVDGAGRPRRGILDAASSRAARDALRTDGLFPTAIESSAGAIAARAESTRLSATLLALTTRQMATLVASGMPLDQALSALAEQADQPGTARLLEAIREQVASGEPLAAAMSRFPRTFSDLYRGLVAVGAETGQLGNVLSRLADYLEARQALRQRFTLALIYPALITIIAFGVITTLLLYVVPQIVAVYQQSRQALPLPDPRAHQQQRLCERLDGIGWARSRSSGSARRCCCGASIGAIDGTYCCCACRSRDACSRDWIRRASRARCRY